jgi:hypothetical protein
VYTDGLVERRDEALDDGLHRLMSHAATLAWDDLDEGLAALVEAVDQAPGADDVTALAVRHTG